MSVWLLPDCPLVGHEVCMSACLPVYLPVYLIVYRSVLLQVEVYKFEVPADQSDLERNIRRPFPVEDPRLKPLIKMRNYFAVVTYTAKQLLTQLTTAEDHFFHHAIRHDAVSGRVFIIFYALHEKSTHAFVRRSVTRLHSRADFPTFVCNIMENVQAWADEEALNRAYRCPLRTQISPQFPYGCQNQLAYLPNCASLLGSPSMDHFQGFIRRYSLKNLVRNNKDILAKRCNWRGRKKSVQDLELLSKAPADQAEPPLANVEKASEKCRQIDRHIYR